MKFAIGELRKYAAQAAYFPQVGSAATVVYQTEKTTLLGWLQSIGIGESRMKFAIGELRKYAACAAYFPQVGSAATVEQQKETGHPFGCPVSFWCTIGELEGQRRPSVGL